MKKLFSFLCLLMLGAGISVHAYVWNYTWSQWNANAYQKSGNFTNYQLWDYQFSTYIKLRLCFNTYTYKYNINGVDYMMPPTGNYTLTGSLSDHKAASYSCSIDGTRTYSIIDIGSNGSYYAMYDGTINVAEGADGPYITCSNLRITDGNSIYSKYSNQAMSFAIGSSPTYRSVTVQSESTTKGTVSYAMKSGYVYTPTQHFKNNSVYTLTATPKSGYRFVCWKKGSTQISTSAVTDVTITGNATYTAYFESMGGTQYTVSTDVSPAGYGTVSGGGTYYENTGITLTATSANEHLYIFDHWLKDGNNYAGGATITPTVTAAATYTAVFRAAAAGTIIGYANPLYGSATVSPSGNQAGGTAVTLTVTPNNGYMFVQWEDGNTDNPRTVYVDGDATYTAQFAVETPLCGAVKYNTANHEILWAKHGDSDWASNYMTWWDEPDNFVRVRASDYTDGEMNHIQLCFWVDDYSVTYNGTIGPKEGTYVVAEAYIAGSGSQNNYWFLDKATYLNKAVVGGDEDKGIGAWRTDLNMIWTTSQSPYCAYIANKSCDYCSPTDFLVVPENSTAKVSRGKGGNCYVEVRNALGRLLFTIGEPASTYALSWDANGGELSGTYTAAGSVNEGTSINAPTATRTGYTFTGWSPAFTGTMPSANTTYVAQWTANTYNVSFAANGGSGTMTNQVFTYGEAQNLKANTFTGPAATVTYDYNGATGGNSPASATVHATFANWTDGVNSYANEAEVSNLTATNGATVALTAEWAWTESIFLPTPTKTGYTFDHWEYGEAPFFLIADAGEEFTLEEDVTMTAQWNTVTYNLTYEGLNGATNSNPATYTVESETITLANPGARDGYVFTGWTCGGEAITEITHGSTGDKTITANWNAKLSSITLEDNRENSFYNTFKTTYDGATGLIVTYARQFTAGRWSTLCLPFNVNKAMFSNLNFGSRIYEFKYATGNADDGVNLYFSIAKSIEAGKGYIVNADDKLAKRTSFTFRGVNIDLSADSVAELNSAAAYDKLGGTSTEGNIELVGTLRKGTLKGTTDGNTYMGLKENKIYYPNIATGSTILAYRGIFRSIKGTLNAERIRIIVDGEEAAELEVINGELQDVQETKKFIENGVLYIERNGIIYDATGRKVE